MKYAKYILILIMLIGFFSPMVKVSAQLYNQRQIEAGINPVTGAAASDEAKKAAAASDEAKKATVTQTPTNKNSIPYTLLAPLPCDPKTTNTGCEDGELKTFDTTNGLGSYLNLMIKIFIGLCAVLSVVMIVVGGLEYMTTELSHSKEAGKEKITQAIFGLLIALGAYALLYTINPDLLKSNINPPEVKVVIPLGSCTVDNGIGKSTTFNVTEANCRKIDAKATWTINKPKIKTGPTSTRSINPEDDPNNQGL